MGDIRVLLVEDHQMVAAAFRSMLDAEPGFEVVGAASTLGEAVTMAAALEPDVAVVDYRLPDGDAADRLRELVAAHPPLRALVVTGWASEVTIARSRAAGAKAVLSKSQKVEDFVDAVRRVHAGESLFPDEDDAGSDEVMRSLSPRELEVLRLLSAGRTTSEIAQHLHVSINTLRNHLTSILGKLGVHSRLEAVTEAMRLGIIATPDSAR